MAEALRCQPEVGCEVVLLDFEIGVWLRRGAVSLRLDVRLCC